MKYLTLEQLKKELSVTDCVTYKDFAGITRVTKKGSITEIDKDKLYLTVKNTIGNLDYIPFSDILMKV